ncbi:MAG: LemA family protein [Ignavibacteriales bacterium CG_4_9_14_3_um_filter_34_10]|nr:MAG: LemA family protein [Ignavibacteriales bacterium CG_4_9_14_3_um_filter_34_10]
MKKGLVVGLSIAGLLIFFVILLFSWGISVYNTLVTMDEQVTSSWSQVQNQYQRRADLVPNLVNTVKGVANFEKETYTAVTEARSKVNQINMSPEILNNPQMFQQFQQAQDGLSSALSRLLVTVEAYPQLKANENFLQLQSQLEGTENRISVERKKFNESVQSYNTRLRKFPGSIIAGFTGFSQKQYFKASEAAQQVPQVQF